MIALIALVACATPVGQPVPAGHETAQPARPESGCARINASVDLDGKPVGDADGATLAIVFASWCEHCHKELDQIQRLRAAHPTLRVLGINYKGHEEYDHRGSATAVRAYVGKHALWLRVVPADDQLFELLGRPPMVPTIYVYNRAGELVASYNRRERAMPDAAELDALVARIERSTGR
jgi:thiol-disulfide isomerase/thioredoxin